MKLVISQFTVPTRDRQPDAFYLSLSLWTANEIRGRQFSEVEYDGVVEEEVPPSLRAAILPCLASYRARKSLDFGQALVELKNGRKVARAGWNGKSMWIALTPGSSFAPSQARNGAAMRLAGERFMGDDESDIVVGAHIDMKAADGSLVIGWLASQTDMLAEDWEIVS